MPTVSTVGCAVPCRASTGTVHSVFARACNIAVDGALVTIGVAPFAGGPTTLVLDGNGMPDLRTLFRAGEPVEWSGRGARSPRVELDFAGAQRWRPAKPRRMPSPERTAANLRIACATPRADPAGGKVRDALARACREARPLRAAGLARRLVGLGAGLTPSGDDFLVGLCAGLHARVGRESDRRRLMARLCSSLRSELPRTTTISAHQLRLAASGQFNEDVLDARDVLVSSRSRHAVRAALARLVAVGASSGAAACEGLRAGLAAQVHPVWERRR